MLPREAAGGRDEAWHSSPAYVEWSRVIIYRHESGVIFSYFQAALGNLSALMIKCS